MIGHTAHPERRSPALSIFLLALSTFVIGTAEFVVMGILPDVAADLQVSIPKAGWLITAYALGMAFGGPILALVAGQFRRKVSLVCLMAFFAVCNLLCAWAPGYFTLMIARILGASAQGAFFGIGAVMAASVVPAHRQASAVALMLTGLTLANVLGVPLGTALGHWLGWRVPFVVISGLSLVGMAGLAAALPGSRGEETVDLKAEVIALRDRRIWISLASTVMFTGSIFPIFTYVAPILKDVTGLSADWIALTLLAIGVGMTAGSYIGGRLSDWSINRALLGIPVAIALASIALRYTSTNFWLAELNWLVWGAVTFSAIPTLQVSVMRFGSNAPNLVSTLNIGALNIGIALGARVGGSALEFGYGLLDIPVIAAAIAVLALVGIIISMALLKQTKSTTVQSTGNVNTLPELALASRPPISVDRSNDPHILW